MAMKVYRFAALGTETFIGNIRMDRFGQRFQIEEKLAQSAQRGGAVLLEETEFKSFGFTDQDLKVWASPFMSQHDVPGDPAEAASKAAFLEKVRRVQARYIEIQQGLLEPHERALTEVPATEQPALLIMAVEEAPESGQPVLQLAAAEEIPVEEIVNGK